MLAGKGRESYPIIHKERVMRLRSPNFETGYSYNTGSTYDNIIISSTYSFVIPLRTRVWNLKVKHFTAIVTPRFKALFSAPELLGIYLC